MLHIPSAHPPSPGKKPGPPGRGPHGPPGPPGPPGPIVNSLFFRTPPETKANLRDSSESKSAQVCLRIEIL